MCLQIVYRTVVRSHDENKRDVRYGNTLNIVSKLCVIFDVQETANCCNFVDLPCTCPTYHTDKQYKIKINSSGGRV